MTDLPEWTQRLRKRLVSGSEKPTWVPDAPNNARPAAVLVVLTGHDDPNVLLIERPATMRNHAGQIAFPGGAIDDTDADPQAAALREAKEEIALDPASVTILGELAPIWVAPSNFVVTPIVAWWHAPHLLAEHNPHEVARVLRPGLHTLAQPETRLRVQLGNGRYGPAFDVDGTIVWGFTGGIVAMLLKLGGWEQPWDRSRTLSLQQLGVTSAPPTPEPPGS
ncbi:MAG: CoA pyrophosphatase [Corynebacteriales bacterium]|nr:CoA pyrophosphatase [Mycobacteriales bacterium]